MLNLSQSLLNPLKRLSKPSERLSRLDFPATLIPCRERSQNDKIAPKWVGLIDR